MNWIKDDAGISEWDLDKIYKYFSAKNNGVGKPEYRLRMYLPT